MLTREKKLVEVFSWTLQSYGQKRQIEVFLEPFDMKMCKIYNWWIETLRFYLGRSKHFILYCLKNIKGVHHLSTYSVAQ